MKLSLSVNLIKRRSICQNGSTISGQIASGTVGLSFSHLFVWFFRSILFPSRDGVFRLHSPIEVSSQWIFAMKCYRMCWTWIGWTIELRSMLLPADITVDSRLEHSPHKGHFCLYFFHFLFSILLWIDDLVTNCDIVLFVKHCERRKATVTRRARLNDRSNLNSCKSSTSNFP